MTAAMAIKDWDRLVASNLALEIDHQDYSAIQTWARDGEGTFDDVALYSCRRRYYAYKADVTPEGLGMLIRLRR